MSSLKHIGYVSSALLPLILGGCCENMAARPYHGVPYCCDRTAGTGTGIYCARPETSPVAMEDPTSITPSKIEPAAGDQVFWKAIQK